MKWCLPDEGCKEVFGVQRLGPSFVNLIVQGGFDHHENILINLETGKAAGGYDDLTSGIATYLAEGQCTPITDRASPDGTPKSAAPH